MTFKALWKESFSTNISAESGVLCRTNIKELLIEIMKIHIFIPHLCQCQTLVGGEMDNTKYIFSEVFIELSSAYGGQVLEY